MALLALRASRDILRAPAAASAFQCRRMYCLSSDGSGEEETHEVASGTPGRERFQRRALRRNLLVIPFEGVIGRRSMRELTDLKIPKVNDLLPQNYPVPIPTFLKHKERTARYVNRSNWYITRWGATHFLRSVMRDYEVLFISAPGQICAHTLNYVLGSKKNNSDVNTFPPPDMPMSFGLRGSHIMEAIENRFDGYFTPERIVALGPPNFAASLSQFSNVLHCPVFTEAEYQRAQHRVLQPVEHYLYQYARYLDSNEDATFKAFVDERISQVSLGQMPMRSDGTFYDVSNEYKALHSEYQQWKAVGFSSLRCTRTVMSYLKRVQRSGLFDEGDHTGMGLDFLHGIGELSKYDGRARRFCHNEIRNGTLAVPPGYAEMHKLNVWVLRDGTERIVERRVFNEGSENTSREAEAGEAVADHGAVESEEAPAPPAAFDDTEVAAEAAADVTEVEGTEDAAAEKDKAL